MSLLLLILSGNQSICCHVPVVMLNMPVELLSDVIRRSLVFMLPLMACNACHAGKGLTLPVIDGDVHM